MTAEHRNVEGIRRVFASFLDGEKRALFDVIAVDAVWRVPGRVPVSQEYAGRDRIFELFRDTRRLTDQTYRSELRWALADDEHAAAVYRARGRRRGRELDIDQALLIDLDEHGRWRRIVALPTEPDAFESFWSNGDPQALPHALAPSDSEPARGAGEHPVAARLRGGFAAFAAGDLSALRDLFAEDVAWTIRGSSPLAGTYAGLDAVVGLLRRTAELTAGSYRVEPRYLLADDEHAVAVYRARGTRDGRSLDVEQALLCRVDGGRLAEVLALPFDQAAFDAFWG